MRVTVVEKMSPHVERARLGVVGDAASTLASKNFLAAIESEDSMFRIAQPLRGPEPEESASGNVWSGDIVLEFREIEHRGRRGLHLALLEKLIELLKEAGSRESLETKLCLTNASITAGSSETLGQPNAKEFALWLRLDAKGDSPEQAVLRWGLGLAHLQQALLFTSRHLRLNLTQPGD